MFKNVKYFYSLFLFSFIFVDCSLYNINNHKILKHSKIKDETLIQRISYRKLIEFNSISQFETIDICEKEKPIIEKTDYEERLKKTFAYNHNKYSEFKEICREIEEINFVSKHINNKYNLIYSSINKNFSFENFDMKYISEIICEYFGDGRIASHIDFIQNFTNIKPSLIGIINNTIKEIYKMNLREIVFKALENNDAFDIDYYLPIINPEILHIGVINTIKTIEIDFLKFLICKIPQSASKLAQIVAACIYTKKTDLAIFLINDIGFNPVVLIQEMKSNPFVDITKKKEAKVFDELAKLYDYSPSMVNYKDSNDHNCTTMFHAIQNREKEIISILVNKCGVSINDYCKGNTIPIFQAIHNKDKEMVEFLLEKLNANLSLENNNGRIPITYAIGESAFDIFHYLMNYADDEHINYVNSKNMTAFAYAIYSDKTEIVNAFFEDKRIDINYAVKNDLPPLHYSILASKWFVAKQLLKHKDTNVNIHSSEGNILNLLAAKNNETAHNFIKEFCDFVNKNSINIDLYTLDNQNLTCIEKAISCDNIYFFECLFSYFDYNPNLINVSTGDNIMHTIIDNSHPVSLWKILPRRFITGKTLSSKYEYLFRYLIHICGFNIDNLLTENYNFKTPLDIFEAKYELKGNHTYKYLYNLLNKMKFKIANTYFKKKNEYLFLLYRMKQGSLKPPLPNQNNLSKMGKLLDRFSRLRRFTKLEICGLYPIFILILLNLLNFIEIQILPKDYQFLFIFFNCTISVISILIIYTCLAFLISA